MRRLLAILFIFGGLLHAAPAPVGEIDNVQLLREERTNEQGHQYGWAYFALNRNSYPVYVSIRLTSSENIYDGLIPGSMLVPAEREVGLGWVAQDDPSSPANWDYEWTVRAAASRK